MSAAFPDLPDLTYAARVPPVARADRALIPLALLSPLLAVLLARGYAGQEDGLYLGASVYEPVVVEDPDPPFTRGPGCRVWRHPAGDLLWTVESAHHRAAPHPRPTIAVAVRWRDVPMEWVLAHVGPFLPALALASGLPYPAAGLPEAPARAVMAAYEALGIGAAGETLGAVLGGR